MILVPSLEYSASVSVAGEVGQPLLVRPVGVHRVDLAVPVAIAREHDPAPVRRVLGQLVVPLGDLLERRAHRADARHHARAGAGDLPEV